MSTLHQLHTNGDRITAHHARRYPSCTHYSQLPLVALIEQFGPDFDLHDNLDLVCSQLRCSKCGTKGKDMSLSFAPPLEALSGYKRLGG